MCDLISKSLIREFLIRRDLKQTLAHFDSEFPEVRHCTRLDLITSLGLERIVKRNQQTVTPLKTIIEILIQHLLNKKQNLEALTLQTVPELISDIAQAPEQNSRQNKMKKRPQSEYRPNAYKAFETIPEQKQVQEVKPVELKPPEQVKVNQDSVFQDLLPAESANKSMSKHNSNNTMDISMTLSNHSQQEKSQQQQQQQQQKQFTIKQRSSDKSEQVLKPDIPQGVIEIPDSGIDEPEVRLDLDIKNLIDSQFDYEKSILFDQKKRRPPSKPIEDDVKKLLFQGQHSNLPKSWSQGFIFKENSTYFGLHQLEGGPCGVIACVQAYYIKHFLFSQQGRTFLHKQNCLMAALAEILFQCGNGRLVLVKPIQMSSETIMISQCEAMTYIGKTPHQIYEILVEFKNLFLETNGVTIFLYTLILTKGVDNIYGEMDTRQNALIGQHGHCNQEAVNLMLTGRATSNCFDGEKHLDDLILKGVISRSEIGFLTIFEHFQYMSVGSHLKCPKLPIFVLCKEYHYSVLFGTDFRVLDDTQHLNKHLHTFDLCFYDGLNNPDDLIRLTIRRHRAKTGVKKVINQGGLQFEQRQHINYLSEKITPLIELVLATKYGEVEIDWNDSLPIL